MSHLDENAFVHIVQLSAHYITLHDFPLYNGQGQRTQNLEFSSLQTYYFPDVREESYKFQHQTNEKQTLYK